MSDPYVRFAPANVGANTATWYVGPEVWTGENAGTDPTFGMGFYVSGNPNRFAGAWDFLVPGPLKDVLTREVPEEGFTAIVMQRWAQAGGEISVIGMDDLGNAMLGAMARPWIVHGGGIITPPQMGWRIDRSGLVLQNPNPNTVPYTSPIRWVVKFSVQHSIGQ